MDNIPPSAWQFLVIFGVVNILAIVEWLWKKFKKMRAESEQLRSEIEVLQSKVERLKDEAGLPLMLKDAPFEDGVVYEIKLVVYTECGHNCVIGVEFDSRRLLKFILLEIHHEIKTPKLDRLHVGDTFTIWRGPYGPSSRGTIPNFKRIEVAPASASN